MTGGLRRQCPDREVKAAVAIEPRVAELRELQPLALAQKPGQAMARRMGIVLAAAAGLEHEVICAALGADASTVGKWPGTNWLLGT